MRAGIIGLPQCGKTTLFNVVTKRKVQTGYGGGSEPNIGVVKVPDARIDLLSKMYDPKKTTYATVEYVDVAGLSKGSVQDGGIGGQMLTHIRNVDALIQVVRTFDSESLSAPDGGIDPKRDLAALNLELIFADLLVVEKRIERLTVEIQKKGDKTKEGEMRVMERMKAHLEQEAPLRQLEFDEDEARLLRNYQFLTMKPMLVVLNIGEDELQDADKYRDIVEQNQRQGMPTVCLSAEIESEVGQLENEEDAKAFMADLGIQEPGLTKLIRISYELLGLMSFFTVGKDEVRAWTIPINTKAVHAAGTIHSDLERGFIRAEVISYDDMIKYETLANARQHGALRLEGKEYIVLDGDIINVRFNV